MLHQKLEHYRQRQLDEKGIAELQKELTEGKITSEELVLMYQENISLKNSNLNAILEINPDALQIAQALDAERKQSGIRSPLHGIPVLIKDNMDTADKMHTSAGSLAMQNHYALQDARAVEMLRKAGAIILGKTSITEWYNFMSGDMPNGYSSRGGQVKNPYGEFDVGGSSSGSAAGIAANLAAAALGTETYGSIINPASQNNLVGLKPTVGLISRRGTMPISHTQDTVGTLARTVEDAVLLFSVLIGADEEDPITSMAKPFENYSWMDHCKNDGLRNVRLGIPRGLFEDLISNEQLKLFEKAIEVLRSHDIEVVDPVDLDATQEDLGFAVLLHEFKSNLNHYLAKSNPQNPIRSLDDLIAYNAEHSDTSLKFGQNILEQANELSGRLIEREYLEALERNRFLAAEQGLNTTLKELNVDVLLLPQDLGCNFTASAGFPSLTVPFGFTDTQEPFGVTFTGTAFSEAKLIECAYAFEQLTKARKKPPIT